MNLKKEPRGASNDKVVTPLDRVYILLMENKIIQTSLFRFRKIEVQKTIPEYVSVRKMRVHDRCISLLSTREDYNAIICPFLKRSHVSRSFSYIRCNYTEDNPMPRPSNCRVCLMNRIRGRVAGDKDRVPNRKMWSKDKGKFWNWRKEYKK